MSKLDQLLTQLQKMDEKFTQRFDAVDQRFDAVDQRFDAVDHRFDAMDHRFDAMDQRIDAIDQRLEGVDQELATLNHKVRGLGLEFEKFRSDQQVQKEVLLELRHQELDKRVTALETRAF